MYSDGLFDNDVREVPLFQKKKNAFDKDIFAPPRRINWIHVLWKYFLNYVFLKDMYKNLKEI